MEKKVKLQKMKLLIMALMIFSAMSINSFSAPKETKKLEWKQISLEPDLDGDGIKDKIDVDYAVEGNDVHLKFTPYVFNEKAKFAKGKSVEKTITKSEFEAKFDTFIKGFIAEYPKKTGASASSQKPKVETSTAKETKKETKTNETDKKTVSQKKNTDAPKGNQKNSETIGTSKTTEKTQTNMEKAQGSVIEKKGTEVQISTEKPKNTSSLKGSYSYIKEFNTQRPKNLTFNFQYDKHSLFNYHK